MIAPPVTPEQLYHQDKRRRKWDNMDIGVTRYLRTLGYPVEGGWYVATNPPDKEIEERRRVGEAVVSETMLL